MIDNNKKKKILHRRWGFVAFLAVIFITAMELWPMVLYPVKVTLKKIKISLYGLIAEVLRGEVISLAGNFDFVEVLNTLPNQIFQICQGLRM